MTLLHWQTSLQTQKGHALTQFLKGTGYGLDSSCTCYGRWLCYFASLWRPYMVHRPTRVGTVGSCIAFEGRFTWSSFSSLQEEHWSNAGPTRADQMFGWLALSGPEPVNCERGTCQSWSPRWWRGCSLEVFWDTRVACSEDYMWSRHVSITF